MSVFWFCVGLLIGSALTALAGLLIDYIAEAHEAVRRETE